MFPPVIDAFAEQEALANGYVDWGARFASEHAERHATIAAPYLRTAIGRIALDSILEKGGATYLPKTMIEPFLESAQLHVVEGQQGRQRIVYLGYRSDTQRYPESRPYDQWYQTLAAFSVKTGRGGCWRLVLVTIESLTILAMLSQLPLNCVPRRIDCYFRHHQAAIGFDWRCRA